MLWKKSFCLCKLFGKFENAFSDKFALIFFSYHFFPINSQFMFDFKWESNEKKNDKKQVFGKIFSRCLCMENQLKEKKTKCKVRTGKWEAINFMQNSPSTKQKQKQKHKHIHTTTHKYVWTLKEKFNKKFIAHVCWWLIVFFSSFLLSFVKRIDRFLTFLFHFGVVHSKLFSTHHFFSVGWKRIKEDERVFFIENNC